MLSDLARSTFGFWLVGLIIAAIDSCVFLKRGEFLYRITGDENYLVRIPRAPFLLRNREVVITLIFYPLIPFLFSSVNSSLSLDIKAKQEIKRHNDQLKYLTWFSLAAAALTLAIGPSASVFIGVNFSILIVAPLLYFNSIATLIYCYLKWDNLNLTRSDFRKLTYELVLCPFLAINIVKRFSSRRLFVVNTERLAGGNISALRDIQKNLENFDLPTGVT